MVFDENQDVKLNSISKSFLYKYNECPLFSWNRKRKTELFYSPEYIKAMEVGNAAHLVMAQGVSEHYGKSYSIDLSPFQPDVLREAKKMKEFFNFKKLLERKELVSIETKLSEKVADGLFLNGIVDLILFTDHEVYGDLIEVIDFKSSFIVGKESDTEVMIYAYLVAKRYGLPILFKRVSTRTRDVYEEFVPLKRALAFKDDFAPYLVKVKETIESDEAPFPTPGGHCQSCPFFEECKEDYQNVDTIDAMIVKKELLDQESKLLGAKIKEQGLNAAENTVGLNSTKYEVKVSVSSSPKVLKKTKGKSKTMKKQEIIESLFLAGEFSKEILPFMDIKLSDEVVEKLEKIGFEIGEQHRKTVKIERIEED